MAAASSSENPDDEKPAHVPAEDTPAASVSGSSFTGPTALLVGSGVQNNTFLMGSSQVTWPHRVGVVPRQADCFQHRAPVDQLATAVTAGETAVVCQVLAGMGGVGKTQLAAHYAHQMWDSRQVDLLVWITAGSREQIQTGYTITAVDVAGADQGDPAAAAERLLAWLAETEKRWLVVLDDLADPADLAGLWPPDRPGGRVVVTTRRRDAALFGPGRRRVDVGIFTEAEAVAYLAATLAAHGRAEPVDQLAALSADLGHLPLALAQAAAYLLDLDLDAPTYRARLADRSRTLTDLAPSALPDDQPAPVAAVWSLSIDRAHQQRPVGLARPLLESAALLDPNGIPEIVLTSPPALRYLASRRPVPEKRRRRWRRSRLSPVSANDARDALRVLHRLSLIDHNPTSPAQTVRIHQLLQRAVRETLPPDGQHAAGRAAADALMAVWPEVERDTTLAQTLRTNTDTLHTTAPDPLWQPDTHRVLFRAASSLGNAGLATAAIDRYHHLADTAHHRFGPDHPDTLT
ncbi:NB-ARC domain-containing protein, partial [Pseudofrankia sp. EUN1h]|uniref:NB-ARC domain-containing protein n=2 Tax=Pseudofrankia TaxID=2994363 RepID=UPI0009F55DBF